MVTQANAKTYGKMHRKKCARDLWIEARPDWKDAGHVESIREGGGKRIRMQHAAKERKRKPPWAQPRNALKTIKKSAYAGDGEKKKPLPAESTAGGAGFGEGEGSTEKNQNSRGKEHPKVIVREEGVDVLHGRRGKASVTGGGVASPRLQN